MGPVSPRRVRNDDEGEAAEGAALGALERLERSGVAVVHGGDGRGAAELEAHEVVRGGHERALRVLDAHGHEGEVGAVRVQRRAIGLQRHARGGPRRPHGVPRDLAAAHEGHGLQRAGRVGDVPHQPVLRREAQVGAYLGAHGHHPALPLPLAAEGAAVEAQLDLLRVGVGHDGDGPPFLPGPGPVREHVHHRLARPLALVEPEAVLGEARQVHDAEVRAAGRPVRFLARALPVVVGSGLAEVVEAGPHELAQHRGRGLEGRELHVRAVGPGRRDHVVAGDLVRRVLLVLLDGQVVDAARADAGGRLRAHHRPLRVRGQDLRVFADAVVEAGDVHLAREAVPDRVVDLVEGGRDRACRIFFVGRSR